MKNYLRVGTLVKQGEGVRNWPEGKVLRIAKRKNIGSDWYPRYKYFVVGVGDPPGYGSWVKADQVRVLTALELLASQATVPTDELDSPIGD